MPSRFIGALWAMAALIAVASWSQPAEALDAAARADVAKAEAYLNDVGNLKARFLQIAPSGDTSEGTIYLSRPGKLRLDYDPPSPIQVIADGSFLIYYDKQLQQTSYLGLGSSPAGILVKAHVQLDSDGLKVLGVKHGPGIMDLTLIQTEHKDQGRITLVFTESPFALKQWNVTDTQGQVTTVSLFAVETGVTLAKSLFQFRDPHFFNAPEPR